MSLQTFVQGLHVRQGLTQTEIARRSGVSQGAIYKILNKIGEPEVATYRKLAGAFPREWRDYIVRHPGFAAALRQEYGFAALASGVQSSAADDPDLEAAMADSSFHATWRRIRAAYRARKEHPDRWRQMQDVVAAIIPDPDAEERPPDRRRRPSREGDAR